MKHETIQTYKSPRWIVFFVSLAMIAVGFVGCHVVEYISQLRDEKFGNDDLLAILFFVIGVAGGFVCVVSGLWIVITAILRYVYAHQPKHPNWSDLRLR